MKLRDLMMTGIRNMWRRKMRTILTLSSVAIGAACIMVTLSLGIGINETFRRGMESMASLTVIDVYPNYSEQGAQSSDMTDKGIAALERIPGVQAVMPYVYVNGTMLSGRLMGQSSFMAIDMTKAKYFDYELAVGILPEGDEKNCILAGSTTVNNFYDTRRWEPGEVDLLNDDIYFYYDRWDIDPKKPPKRSEGIKLNITGIIREYQQEQDYTMYMDIDLYKKLKTEKDRQDKNNGGGSGGGDISIGGRPGMIIGGPGAGGADEFTYNNFKVKVTSFEKVNEVTDMIKEAGYGAWSSAEYLNTLNEQTAMIRGILLGLGIVVLFVSAIFVINTMLMAVHERTREIGIMKVIGAKVGDIRRQFLFEAAAISVLGGVLGLLFSFIASTLLNTFGGSMFGDMYYLGNEEAVMSLIPMWLYGLGLSVSAVVGLLSGFYPAHRAASKISALEAIKSE